MKEIIKRLKSPVVIIQIISIIATVVVSLIPEKEAYIDKIVYSLAVIINVFAGVNNPTNREGF